MIRETTTRSGITGVRTTTKCEPDLIHHRHRHTADLSRVANARCPLRDRTQNHIAVGPLDPLEHRCLFRISRPHRQTGAFAFHFHVGIAQARSLPADPQDVEEEHRLRHLRCAPGGRPSTRRIGGADPDKTFRPVGTDQTVHFHWKRCGTFCGPRPGAGVQIVPAWVILARNKSSSASSAPSHWNCIHPFRWLSYMLL